MEHTPQYIKGLLAPVAKAPQGRKAWSIDLQQVWLPFFTATNTMNDTAIPTAALGAPLRLGYDKAGQVRFSQAGRPIIRIAKEIEESVRMVRDNFTANLIAYAGKVAEENTEEYKATIEESVKAGEPVKRYDNSRLQRAYQKRAEAEAVKKTEPEPEPELVTA